MSFFGVTMSSRCRMGCDSVCDGSAVAVHVDRSFNTDSGASGSGCGFRSSRPRRLWTVCVRGVVESGVESLCRQWRTRPRDAIAVVHLVRRNLVSTIAVLISGIIMVASSTPELRYHLGDTIVFPLYLPHAVSLSMAGSWSAGVAPGNFTGLYLARIYVAARGRSLTSTSGSVLFLVSVLATLQSHVAGYYLRERLCNGRNEKKYPTIDTLADAAWFLIVVTATTVLFSTFMALCATITPLATIRAFWEMWSTWWLGILAAMVTVTPLGVHLMAWKRSPDWKRPAIWLEVAVTAVIAVGLFTSVFILDLHRFRPMPYLCFPLVTYTALRFNRVGWAIAVSAVAFFSAMGTIREKGPFHLITGRPVPWNAQPLLQVQLFSIVMGVVSITLAAAVRENKSLTRRLHQMNRDLECTVACRTRQLLVINEELQISQKEAELASHAKSEFLANMSHEIRTPIHGILGLTALLLESELTVDQKESLVSVKECADLLLHIINSVLDLAKIEAGRLEVETVPFNVRKMVSSTFRMMQARAQERGLKLFWEVDQAVPPSLAGDVGKLQQCLINLVGNALKFTHEGSISVHVRVASDSVIESRMNHARSSHGSSAISNRTSVGVPHTMSDYESSSPPRAESMLIHFEVRDTGIGIDKEKLKDMFKPFAQAEASTSRLYGGTGLGLCIVHRFVELLGGTIWVESEAGKGSTFHFCSPLSFSPSSKPAASAESSPEAKLTPSSTGSKMLKAKQWSPVDGLVFNNKLHQPSSPEYNNSTGAHERVISMDDLSAYVSRKRESHFWSPNNDQGRLRVQDKDPSWDGERRSSSSDREAFTEMRDATRDGYFSGGTMPLRPHGIELVDGGAGRAGDDAASELYPPTVQSGKDSVTEAHGDDLSSSPGSSKSSTPTAAGIEENGDAVLGTSLEAQGTSERGFVALDLSRNSSAADLGSLSLQNKLKLKILLVEDNPINQKVASRQLQKHGHAVTVVGDGQQAFDTVCARHDQFDLVLMDVEMPIMDGLAATEKIRVVEAEKGWSRVPILGLTAHAIQGYQNTCLVHGMDGYLGKPFDIQQLLKTIGRLLPH